MTPWLTVLGIGEDGLDPAGRAIVESAEVPGRRQTPSGARRARGRRSECPGSGRCPGPSTPFLRGARGRQLCWRRETRCGSASARRWRGMVPAEEMRILPAVGAFSLAAARLAWPLDSVAALSLHGRPLGLLALHVAPGAKLLALSHDGGTPSRVAAWLTGRGYGASRMTALAHMGGPLETCVAGTRRLLDRGGSGSQHAGYRMRCRRGRAGLFPCARPAGRFLRA